MYVLAVSAGHYPEKPGAVRNGVSEHDEAVAWVDGILKAITQSHLRTELYIEGHAIKTGSLPYKVKQVNEINCDLALEVHFNAATNDAAKGCETLYYPGSVKGKNAANAIQSGLAVAMQTRSRGAVPGWYRMDRPGVIDYEGDVDGDEKPDYFLRKTNCTALILEPEFLYHIDEIRALRKAGCWAIAKSVFGMAWKKYTESRESSFV